MPRTKPQLVKYFEGCLDLARAGGAYRTEADREVDEGEDARRATTKITTEPPVTTAAVEPVAPDAAAARPRDRRRETSGARADEARAADGSSRRRQDLRGAAFGIAHAGRRGGNARARDGGRRGRGRAAPVPAPGSGTCSPQQDARVSWTTCVHLGGSSVSAGSHAEAAARRRRDALSPPEEGGEFSRRRGGDARGIPRHYCRRGARRPRGAGAGRRPPPRPGCREPRARPRRAKQERPKFRPPRLPRHHRGSARGPTTTRPRRTSAAARSSSLQAATQSLEQDLRASEAQRDEARGDADQLRGDAKRLRSERDEARGDAKRLRRERDEARKDAATSERALAALRQKLDRQMAGPARSDARARPAKRGRTALARGRTRRRSSSGRIGGTRRAPLVTPGPSSGPTSSAATMRAS